MALSRAEYEFSLKLGAEAQLNPPKPLLSTSLEEFRANISLFLQHSGAPADVPVIDVDIPMRDGHLAKTRIFNHQLNADQPFLLMYPGCGFICDLFEANAIALSRVARYANVKVIMSQFRLTPEVKFPIPLNDAFDIAKYIVSNAAKFNINPAKMIMGGFSSGACASSIVSKLAYNDPELKILHQLLYNGSYDLLRSSHDYDAYEKEDYMLDPDTFEYIFSRYGLARSDYNNPQYSPYYETDFSQYPKTTFIVSEYDGCRNDTESYYKKLLANNVAVDKIVIPGQTHNNLILRGAMADEDDPAKVIADVIRRYI